MVAPFEAQGKQGEGVHPRGDGKYAQGAEHGRDIDAT